MWYVCEENVRHKNYEWHYVIAKTRIKGFEFRKDQPIKACRSDQITVTDVKCENVLWPFIMERRLLHAVSPQYIANHKSPLYVSYPS